MVRSDTVAGLLERFRRFPFSRRLMRSGWVLALVSTAILLLRHAALPDQFATTALDTITRLRAPQEAKRVQLVVIDQRDYEKYFDGTSPLKPSMLGRVLAIIASGQPDAIVVDLDTSDARFASTPLPQNPPLVIWGVAPRIQGNEVSWKRPLGGSGDAVSIPCGIAALPIDKDGRVRRYLRRIEVRKGVTLPSLPYAAALALGMRPVGSLRNEVFLAMLGRGIAFPKYTIAGLMVAGTQWNKQNPALRGRVVVLGGTYSEARDEYPTPAGPMGGVELVGLALENELTGSGVPASGKFALGILQVLAGALIAFLYHRFRLRTALFSSITVIPILSLVCSWLAFSTPALWVYFVPVQVAIMIQQLYSKAEEYRKLWDRSQGARLSRNAEP